MKSTYEWEIKLLIHRRILMLKNFGMNDNDFSQRLEELMWVQDNVPRFSHDEKENEILSK